jgi:exodeoxyribonuclease-1
VATTFFFYDLETSGISSKRDRIMQFGGQRTDENLNPIGEPYNQLIKLSPDILPSPEAILITGISPFDCNQKGISEAEFAEIFNNQIAIADTIFVGFNNLRFDDEFIRFLNYRNFYDAYRWHWDNGSSRWDLLDPIRMTRALRPDAINWPVTDENKPTNKLELLTKANGLDHDSAHDALSDVVATIEVASLLKAKQPKLFNFLLGLRKKDQVINLVSSDKPFVYTSSHFSSSFLHTTIVGTINIDPSGSALVFDLRNDPSEFLDLSVDELVERWHYDPEARETRLPVKTMKFNRCPAIAPLNVLDKDSLKRLDLDIGRATANFEVLKSNKQKFSDKLKLVIKEMDVQRDKRFETSGSRVPTVDEKLYDKFIDNGDVGNFLLARQAASNTNLTQPTFKDSRLNQLYELYKARNYQQNLNSDDLKSWREYINSKLFEGGDKSPYVQYKVHLDELIVANKDNQTKLDYLEDLKKYSQSIADEYEAR